MGKPTKGLISEEIFLPFFPPDMDFLFFFNKEWVQESYPTHAELWARAFLIR